MHWPAAKAKRSRNSRPSSFRRYGRRRSSNGSRGRRKSRRSWPMLRARCRRRNWRCTARRWWRSEKRRLGRAGALRVRVERENGLARAHEEPVALRSAKGDVRAHFGQPDAADQFARGIPDGDAVVANLTSGVAGRPEIAIDVDTNAVGSAFDAVDHEVAEVRG